MKISPSELKKIHSDVPHMPVAISLRHLLDIVKIRIEQKHPNDESKLQRPSLEWLRLQFSPHNPYSLSALRHTGRIDLKFGVQIHQLRQDHVDSHYISVLLQYLKEFSAAERFCNIHINWWQGYNPSWGTRPSCFKWCQRTQSINCFGRWPKPKCSRSRLSCSWCCSFCDICSWHPRVLSGLILSWKSICLSKK